METKNIINKISEQKNVDAMKTELNELKVLFNSIESAIVSYTKGKEEAQAKLVKLNAELTGLYNSSLVKAEEKFKTEEAELVKASQEALVDLNDATNSLTTTQMALDKSNEEVKKAEELIDKYIVELDDEAAELSELKKLYTQEIKEFEMGYKGGQITGLRDAKFLSSEDIVALNKLFNKIFKSKSKIKMAKEQALLLAELKFNEEEERLNKRLAKTNDAIANNKNVKENAQTQVASFNDMLKDLGAKKDAYEETYNAIVVKLAALRNAYTEERSNFVGYWEKGGLSCGETQFIPTENVKELDKLCELKFNILDDIDEYQEKIDNSTNERDEVAKKINDLDLKVSTLLLEREMCKAAVNKATEVAVEKTTAVAGTVAKGVGKGLKVASALAKIGLDQGKKKVNDLVQKMEEDAKAEETTQDNCEQPQVNETKTIFGETVGDIKKFIGKNDFKADLNEFIDETKADLNEFVGETKKIAEDLGVDKAIEQGKVYFKEISRNWGNLIKKDDKKDGEE